MQSVGANLEAPEDVYSAALETVQQAERALEAARSRADEARWRYEAVNPDNCLVADELERLWNDRLRVVQAGEERLSCARTQSRRQVRTSSRRTRRPSCRRGADLERAGSTRRSRRKFAFPILANVFLHYVIDLWFHKAWRPNVPDGESIVVRYADDFVVGFQYKRDAEQYLRDVRERLARFGLGLHPDKTRLVEFGRFASMNRRQRGVGKPETFDFPGFTHDCTTTRRGRFRLSRKPIAKRVDGIMARIGEALRVRRNHDIWEVAMWLGRVCEGWLKYFAVPESSRFIRVFVRRLQRLWMRALRRRSQRDRFGWKRLERMTESLWPRASIRHPWPDQRFAVMHPR